MNVKEIFNRIINLNKDPSQEGLFCREGEMICAGEDVMIIADDLYPHKKLDRNTVGAARQKAKVMLDDHYCPLSCQSVCQARRKEPEIIYRWISDRLGDPNYKSRS